MTEDRPPGSFSPELALVDPDAAERGRDDLPAVVLTEDAAPPRRAEEQPRAQRRTLWVLVCIAAVAGAGTVLAIRLTSGTGDAGTTVSTAPGATLAARAIPDFVWVAATNAARYRVEFVRDGRVVLRRTSTVPRLHVAASALPPGTYHWRVWALGAHGSPRGAALVDASVDIP